MADIHSFSTSPPGSQSSNNSLANSSIVSKVPEQFAQATTMGDPTPQPKLLEDISLMLESQPEAQLDQPMTDSWDPASSVQKPSATPSRTVPRLNTRNGSTSAPLPWKIDETSSPYSPMSHGRKESLAPPPPRAGHRASVDASSPRLPPLQTSSPPYHSAYAPSTPYTNTSSSSPSISSVNSQAIDLTHPPGYSQDAHRSFSDSVKSTYENSTPFYQNNFSSSVASPITPTRRGRGILDNDPAIYLAGESDADEDSMWDTAAKWAKAAGKRLSAGEQQIWRMVNAVANGEGDG